MQRWNRVEFNILKYSITGYKNLIKGFKSQDYIDYKKDDKYIICSIADGHSTAFFKHSSEGARFACKAVIDVLSEIYNMDIYKLEEKLTNYEIQKQIDIRWRCLVDNHYKKNYPNVFKIEYIKYSTTLLSVLITDKFILYLKLGDGEIVVKSKKGYKGVIDTRDNLIVDSLGREGEYKKIMYRLEEIKEHKDINIALFTDGYSNAFKDKIDLFNSIEKTLQEYKKNVFSRYLLLSTYESYLDSISKNITHDDISIMFIL